MVFHTSDPVVLCIFNEGYFKLVLSPVTDIQQNENCSCQGSPMYCHRGLQTTSACINTEFS